MRNEAPLYEQSLPKVFGKMLVGAVFIVLLWAPPAGGQNTAEQGEDALSDLEEFFEEIVGHSSASGYYTWVDEDGETITYTAMTPSVGDSYITADNRLYEVTAVEEDRTVRAKFVEEVQLGDVAVHARPGRAGTRAIDEARAPWWARLAARLAWWRSPAGTEAQTRTNGESGPIGIYHSHNAESYVETSDEEFKVPLGDVVEVGRALKQALEEQGYNVIHSENSHLPHDGGAYQRSRATVRELLDQGAVALIDVHRDAIPADAYRTEVEGENMTKIRLVVGRQNPNQEANLQLAKNIKAIADEQYPGLVKGIFNARGNYNQDIGPRTILLEFGTHETSLDEAIRSTKYVAEVFPAAAGLAPGSGGAADAIGGAAWRSVFWVVLIAAAGLFGYLWINEGSVQGAWNRIRGFFRRSKVGAGGGRDDGRS